MNLKHSHWTIETDFAGGARNCAKLVKCIPSHDRDTLSLNRLDSEWGEICTTPGINHHSLKRAGGQVVSSSDRCPFHYRLTDASDGGKSGVGAFPPPFQGCPPPSRGKSRGSSLCGHQQAGKRRKEMRTERDTHREHAAGVEVW